MKKNIMIIVNRMTGAGPARVVSNLTLSLSNQKYNKYIVIYDAKNSMYTIDAKKIINLNTRMSRNPIKRLINTIKRIRIIRRLKKQFNIDTSISLLSNPNLVNILSRVNEKVIISERNYKSKDLAGFYRAIYKLIYKKVYNKADLLVAVSKVVKNDLVANFGIQKNTAKVVYNFYDIDTIECMARQELTPHEKELFSHPVIINVGRIDNQKGQWHLIRAFQEVKKQKSNLKLVILGEDNGSISNYLYRLIEDSGLEDDIHLLGFQSNPFKYISKADLFVFPSLYEGFPNALAEAMACGLPVISSDCPSGPREILSPGLNIDEPMIEDVRYEKYGVLVPTPDGTKYTANDPLTKEEEILAETIITMINDEKLLKKYKEKSIERIADFHKDKILKEWEAEL